MSGAIRLRLDGSHKSKSRKSLIANLIDFAFDHDSCYWTFLVFHRESAKSAKGRKAYFRQNLQMQILPST